MIFKSKKNDKNICIKKYIKKRQNIKKYKKKKNNSISSSENTTDDDDNVYTTDTEENTKDTLSIFNKNIIGLILTISFIAIFFSLKV